MRLMSLAGRSATGAAHRARCGARSARRRSGDRRPRLPRGGIAAEQELERAGFLVVLLLACSSPYLAGPATGASSGTCRSRTPSRRDPRGAGGRAQVRVSSAPRRSPQPASPARAPPAAPTRGSVEGVLERKLHSPGSTVVKDIIGNPPTLSYPTRLLIVSNIRAPPIPRRPVAGSAGSGG